MSKRLLKCYGYCGNKYPKEELLKFKVNPKAKTEGSNHCQKCFELKTKDVRDREDLYHYIQDTYSLNFPTGTMLRQIKIYKEERRYTYKNIRFTLDFVFNVKKVYKPQTKFGIGFVPHFYDEMIDYYKDLKERRAGTVVEENKIIRVQLKPSIRTINEHREKKFINMEDLLK